MSFVGLFRPDAIWTTGHGKCLFGRDEISAFTHQVLPGSTHKATATYEVVHPGQSRWVQASVTCPWRNRQPAGVRTAV